MYNIQILFKKYKIIIFDTCIFLIINEEETSGIRGQQSALQSIRATMAIPR